MPLSWNEIRDRALSFSREWADETSENAEAKSFWDAFFNVFGITRRRIVSFEEPVKKSDGKGGFIDLVWKGILLVEHKSRGKDLDRAFQHHFGILTSSMHMAWMRSIGGRLESRYRYSAGIVYNNFPWPQAMTEKQKLKIEKAAQEVLDARAKFPNSSLADLYDPLTMPPDLVKAHHKLDAAYSRKKFSGDSARVAFLFELYQQLAAAQIITT